MPEQIIREIFYYKNYYLDFYDDQAVEVRKKMNWTLLLISTLERIPTKYFEHLTGTNGLFEIRVEVGSNIFRIFSFFDEGKLIVLLNGFQKKTQKTPKNEIEMAQKLKKQYYDDKETK